MKKYFFEISLGITILIAFFLRVNQLGSLPPGMTDDEIRVVENAYSLWHTGRDVTGSILLPFSFVLNGFSFTPVSVYATAPFVGLFGLSPLTARLPFALAGLGVVVLTFLVTLRLAQNKTVALLSAMVLAVNVWAIQLSRMAYEAVFAQLFYLWAVYIFLADFKKRAVRTIVISMILSFLAFNSYNAMKVLLIPVLAFLILYRWRELRSRKFVLWTIAIATAVTFGIFGYFTYAQGASAHGGDVTIFQKTAAAAEHVELMRRASTAPETLKVLYHNKVTYFLDLVTRHYLYAYSPDFLFLNQEASGIYSLWNRGNFYKIELPLLILGALFLFANKRKPFWLVAAMLLVAPLPSAIGPEPLTYATRSSFLLPWMAMVIASGLVYGVMTIRARRVRTIVIGLVILLYFGAVGGYLRQYYFEWPRYGAKYFAKDLKDVVSYIVANERPGQQFLITNINDTFLLQYAFYTRMNPRTIQAAYGSSVSLASLGPVRVLPACITHTPEDPRLYLGKQTTYIVNPICHEHVPDARILLPDDTVAWNIYRRD